MANIMRIIHLSDLHFGTEDAATVKYLHDSICAHAPDLIIISGDFTQIGSKAEFEVAHNFIKSLPCTALCVPGNHDVPAKNLMERFLTPFSKYREFIAEELNPTLQNNEITVIGLNSARRALPHWNWANGAISLDQREKLITALSTAPSKHWKICTFHHPIHKIDDMPIDVTVFGANKALKTLDGLQVDLVLTGHVHHASITMRGNQDHQTVYLSASTALSSRTRGQENGFNVITLTQEHMLIEMYKLGSSGFVIRERFEKQR